MSRNIEDGSIGGGGRKKCCHKLEVWKKRKIVWTGSHKSQKATFLWATLYLWRDQWVICGQDQYLDHFSVFIITFFLMMRFLNLKHVFIAHRSPFQWHQDYAQSLWSFWEKWLSLYRSRFFTPLKITFWVLARNFSFNAGIDPHIKIN